MIAAGLAAAHGMEILDEIRLLGDPFLRRPAQPVADVDAPGVRRDADRLQRALAAFRARHGFGRAIAAPQLGIARRLVAFNLGDGPFTMLDPSIAWRSPDTFTLWDDCMSFPDLLVRVRRHARVSVEWTDEAGRRRLWEALEPDVSELLQHEIDHLDGVLAVDRALDRDALAWRPAFEADRARYESMLERAPRPRPAARGSAARSRRRGPPAAS